jgi:hypothetical protein
MPERMLNHRYVYPVKSGWRESKDCQPTSPESSQTLETKSCWLKNFFSDAKERFYTRISPVDSTTLNTT